MIMTTIDLCAAVCFALAVLHTFSVKYFHHLALKYRPGSFGENIFHLLGEIEVVFGVWAAIFVFCIYILSGSENAIQYLETRNFTEPAFVFVIMAVSATRPILLTATKAITLIARLIPLNKSISFYIACLIFGPLLGSLITEPAAMTVTAIILLNRYFTSQSSLKFKYATLGLLFVNISIGGTLTPYAAPPVLMVAQTWGWDLTFMLTNFGWRAVIAVTISTLLVTYRFRRELKKIEVNFSEKANASTPIWVKAIYFAFLIMIIINAHHMVIFMGVFLFFLGLVAATKEYNDQIKLRESLLVGFFLGGLVILGGHQRWWLEPIITQLSEYTLYFGAIALTAFTDNAALTYLGSQVPTLSEAARYTLVAGSVVGGGLTVIANAPNPAGYGILNASFGDEGISPLQLFFSAVPPTIVAAILFLF